MDAWTKISAANAIRTTAAERFDIQTCPLLQMGMVFITPGTTHQFHCTSIVTAYLVFPKAAYSAVTVVSSGSQEADHDRQV
jgi:hypothetical protein